MSFNFGAAQTPKTAASSFTLPANPNATTTATGLQFNFASGDTKSPAKATTLFPSNTSSPALNFGNTPKPASAPTSTPAFGFSTPSTHSTTTPNFSLGGTTGSVPSSTTTQYGLSTSKPSTTTLTTLLSSTPAPVAPTSIASIKPSFGTVLPSATLTTTPSAAGTLFGGTPAVTSTTAVSALGLPAASAATSSAAASSALINTSTTAPTYSTSILPSTGSMTFSQLEDSINRWTIDLEEQGKFFINQAKQLNAWDSLLITNGEKILNLNSSIERVKQQQQQLDQELDFVLSQQKELEELIVPLEKELLDIPVTDIDRNQMYQFSEIIDSQLKQMSDDLKEIVEHINESNKDEEITNPINQISRIMNAHMNSLQWLDRNTAQITSHLDQISKIQDSNKRNFTLNNSFNM